VLRPPGNLLYSLAAQGAQQPGATHPP
jgi:hypothetical protein